jgi:hypothetical protein
MPIILASAEAEVGDTVQPKEQDQQGHHNIMRPNSLKTIPCTI